MMRKRLPTRVEFERLARLIQLLLAACRELRGNKHGIGCFLSVRWVDRFGDHGTVGKAIGQLRSKLDDLACRAERSDAAMSVFYGNRATEALVLKHLQALLADTTDTLPEEFLQQQDKG